MDADSQDSPHGQRLRAARKARGWSLQDAADATALPKSSWQGWEEGVFPPADRAIKIAAALSTTVEAIWGQLPADDANEEPTKAPEFQPARGGHTSNDFVGPRDSSVGAGV